MASVDEQPPAGVYHYDEPYEVPDEVSKYWYQRHRIFSKYDEGIWMTDSAWFGVTPEPVAREIASAMSAAPAAKTVLIDAFGGAGGNAIQFALSGRWETVFVVEKDPAVLACAKHNAKIYGVANKMWFINGDIFDQIKTRLRAWLHKAVMFASPPWGGPEYSDFEVFDLSNMQPYSLSTLHQAFCSKATHVALFLPRTSDLRQIAKLAGEEKIEVTHYCMHGASKALCAFVGDFKGLPNGTT